MFKKTKICLFSCSLIIPLLAAVAQTPPETKNDNSVDPKLLPMPAATETKWTPPNRKLSLPKKILDFSLQPATVNTNPGPEYDDDAREVNMTPAIERTPKGRLWSAWISGGDEDTGYVVAASSDDDGKTWSKPRLVIDPFDPPGARQRSICTNIWLDPLGRLWLYYDQSLDYFDGRAGLWVTVCENPDAPEPKWSIPRRIWHGAMLNKPTIRSNGEWLFPIDLWQCVQSESRLLNTHNNLIPLRGVNLFVSTDQGRTWKRRGGINVINSGLKWDFDEVMIIERKDGSLWMPLRTRTAIMETISTDGGATWSTPVPASFNSTNSRFYLRRLKSGRILLVKNGNLPTGNDGLYNRKNMTAFLSDDDGKTWKGGLILDERAGVSYPDGTQGPDGKIYITYDRDRYAVPPWNTAEILMADFTEDDVLAGKLITPGARLKVQINVARPQRD